MNLGFPKSNLLHKLSIYTYFKIKLDRINAISHCTTPFYMPPFPWFLNESQKKQKAWNLARKLVLDGVGFSKQLMLNSDNIYISNILNVSQTKFVVQFLDFHFIFSFKIFKVALFLISVVMFHTFELNTLRKFRPCWLVLVELLRNSVCDLRLYLRP